MKIKELIKKYFSDFSFKTYFAASFSSFLTLIYAIFNFCLGLYYKEHFYTFISIYYFLLFVIRIVVLMVELKTKRLEKTEKKQIRIRTYNITKIFTIILNISLIGPIILMIKNPKANNYGLIPSLAFAFYTTLKCSFALVNFSKSRKLNNLSLIRLREINMVEAIVSILNLQQMLIMMESGMTNEMLKLSSVTSFVFYICILALPFLERNITKKISKEPEN